MKRRVAFFLLPFSCIYGVSRVVFSFFLLAVLRRGKAVANHGKSLIHRRDFGLMQMALHVEDCY